MHRNVYVWEWTKKVVLTSLALIAFAANSVICRLALGDNDIDPASFTSIRLLAGACVLFVLVHAGSQSPSADRTRSWIPAIMLFVYATAFSFAYVHLETGTGALILFGSVQITMVVGAMLGGARLHITEWFGLVFAFGGLVYLNFPVATAPSLQGFVLMAFSGCAWGIYTLRGRGSSAPLADTQRNFLLTLPFVAVLAVFSVHSATVSTRGAFLAMISGGVASGLGYVVWYGALRFISATQAAVLQLSVPAIAATGGVWLIGEVISLRLVISGAMILGGILIVLVSRRLPGDPGK